MVNLGNNMRTTVSPRLRDDIVKFYTEILECAQFSPHDELDVFTFKNGHNIGVYYSEDALSEEQIAHAIWLEIKTDDQDGVIKKLAETGIMRMDYADKDHFYFRAPGGQVFRIADLHE